MAEELSIEELKSKALEESRQPARHVVAKDRIRHALEPYNDYISDETLYHILLVCGGNLRRSMHKALLTIQAEAFRTRNIPLKTWSREALRTHEAGLLLK